MSRSYTVNTFHYKDPVHEDRTFSDVYRAFAFAHIFTLRHRLHSASVEANGLQTIICHGDVKDIRGMSDLDIVIKTEAYAFEAQCDVAEVIQ